MKKMIASAWLMLAVPASAIPPDPELVQSRLPASSGERLASMPCTDGSAGQFECRRVDLLAYVPLADMGCGGHGNDIWGWTDPDSGTEYALMGCTDGTAFVDLSDPENPVHIGNLPSHTGPSTWRDIKVYEDHAYVVSEASGHGLQVFDLTQLRDVLAPPVVFSNTAHLGSFGQAHNVAINKDTGFAYVVGAGRNNSATCFGGLYMVNIQKPANPQFAGCFSADGYTHDTQCVIYQGPDENYQGNEICFNANENTLTIVDVSDKANPVMLGRETYPGVGYVHQGWLTEDHHYFLLGDETDEINHGHNTRTRIWDVSDLDAPEIIGIHDSTEDAIDHNLYTRGSFVYQSNYTAGLRILDLHEVGEGELTEVAYFDVFPAQLEPRHDGGPGFHGTWSNYPYFDSGIVIVSSIGSAGEPGGLFVLQPRLDESWIQGVVTRSDTGEPVPEVTVEIQGETLRRTVSDGDGNFELEAVTGTYQVTAALSGYFPATVEGVEVESGQPAQVNLALAPAPQADVSPEAMVIETVTGITATAPLTIANAGEGELDWSVVTDAAPVTVRSDAPDPDLDETLALADFSLPGGGSHQQTVPGGLATAGQVIGFTFQGTVSGITGTGTWASDLQMTVTGPDDSAFTVGGFGASNPWDFDGSGSTNDGTYASTHVGGNVFGAEGTADQGPWQFEFEHTWNDPMDWSDVTVTLHKLPHPVCQDPESVSWLAVEPASGTVAPEQAGEAMVTVDAGALSPGQYQAYLCVLTNDPESPLLPVAVEAFVTEAPPGAGGVAPEELDFGEQLVGSDSVLAFKVLNTGGAGATAIELTGIGLTKGADWFALTGGSCVVGSLLAGGEDCSIEVTFSPGEPGPGSGVAVVEIDDGSVLTVDLTGDAIPAGQLSAEPASLAFGQAWVGWPVQAVVEVGNAAGDGAGPLQISALELLDGAGGFTLGDGGSCEPGLTSLDPGQSCSVVVVFTPSTEDDHGDLLTVIADDGVKGQSLELDLSGTGIPVPDEVFDDRFEP